MSDFTSEIPREVKVCYKRKFLLSLSHFDSCHNLPSQFNRDLSVALLQSCDSESGWSENGLLGKPSFPREDGGGKVGASSPSALETMRHNTESGLLGKASFPRKPECSLGVSPTEFQTSGFHLLSRSATPYRPPHLSKVEIKGTNDANSFGSADFSSMEKADEKRMIRDSFELTTKEEKDFQEKHEHLDSDDITTLLEDSANDFEKRNQSDKTAASPTSVLTSVISVPGNTITLEDTSGQDLDEKSDEVEEICLPDEDSLITVEDFIVPKELLLTQDEAWSSTGIGSATAEEIFVKLPVLSDYRKSKPSMENTYLEWNAGQLNPHFYQPHANPTGNHLFYSQSQTGVESYEAEWMNTEFLYDLLASDLAFSTTLQSGAVQNFYDPFVQPSQRQIQPPGGRFPITHRTAPSRTKNSQVSANHISGDFENSTSR